MDAAAVLEQNFAEDSENYSEALDLMLNELTLVLSGIRGFFADESDEEKTPRQSGTEERLKQILSELRPSVSLRKPKKCEEFIQQLQQNVWPEEYAGDADEIVELIGDYKFVPALKLVDKLLAQFD